MIRRASLAVAVLAVLACSKSPAKKGPVVASGGLASIEDVKHLLEPRALRSASHHQEGDV